MGTGKTGPVATRWVRLHPALLVALGLGLRRGEVLGPSWVYLDFDAEQPVIRIRRQLIRRPEGSGLALTDLKTKKSRRTIVIPSTVAAALRGHRTVQAKDRTLAGPELANGDGLVFTTPLGTP